jgi:hypothetical protein
MLLWLKPPDMIIVHRAVCPPVYVFKWERRLCGIHMFLPMEGGLILMIIMYGGGKLQINVGELVYLTCAKFRLCHRWTNVKNAKKKIRSV